MNLQHLIFYTACVLAAVCVVGALVGFILLVFAWGRLSGSVRR